MTESPENLEFLHAVELFSALDADGLQKLAESVELCSCAAGEVLFHEGDPGNDLFILKNGELGVFVQRGRGRQRRIGTVKPSQCVGEMGLFFAGTRLATVAAEQQSELLKLGRNAFQDLLQSNPSLRSVFGKIIEQRLPRLRVVLTELFGNIDDEVFRDIEQNLRWHRLQRGDTLFEQGDIGNELYLL
ncbi:MAG: cyclic nucleotide-binding domain-containing protein, partial [Gammaproteobacteria bacterium]|nr:cyclic nucleotide-binding domain-containing protein [Gammaproteobacteria bacterium]NNM01920.1 cyclic nucleotide-binding domain-containing protein [Gammaproteobacteria bacterium]